MIRLLIRWGLLAFSVYAASLVSQALHLGFQVDADSAAGVIKLLIGVAVLSFLNATVGRILKFLTMPIGCLTLGISSLVINAAVLWWAATLRLGFKITESGFDGFIAALVASLLIAFINGVLGVLLPDDDKDD